MSDIQNLTAAVQEIGTKAAAGIEELRKENKRLQAELTDVAQKAAPGHQGNPSLAGAAKNPLHNLAHNDQLKAFINDRSIKSASVKLDQPLPLLLKNIVTGGTFGSSDALGFDVQPQRDPRLGEDPRRRLSLMEQLPRIQVNSNAFEFNILDGYTNAAAVQADEGDAKATASMPTELQISRIATYAHVQGFSEQVLADSPALEIQARSLLTFGVMAKVEADLIAGTGDIMGLQTVATPFSYSGTLADAVGAAASKLDELGWNATHVVMHPADWQAIRSERDNEGSYVAAGWASPAAPSMWGMAVVTNVSVLPGEPVVFDATQVALLDRMQARVELGRIDDDFNRNIVRMRAEGRYGLAIFSPSAILTVMANGSSSV